MKKSSDAYAVIGLGFGDEGKGVVVNSLCQQLISPLVIRYSGGQQAGHTVTLKDGTSHVFSNFGSGTLQGVPTYWSKFCTFDPEGVFNEFHVLKTKGFSPTLYIDKRSPITTPYDKFHNQNSEAIVHGTCGAGVGSTLKREEDFQSLLAGDLLYPSVFEAKLKLVKQYYKNNASIKLFLECCEFIKSQSNFQFVDTMPSYSSFVYEGSQGLLLDKNTGFFPHVTRSSIGPKNIAEYGHYPRLLLVTRAFQTRHGNGPMTNTDIPHNIKDNPKETNVLNAYQGEFKKSLLDLDLLKYGMDKDEYIKHYLNSELIITCLDLVENEYRYTAEGKIVVHPNQASFIRGIADYLGIRRVSAIASPSGTFDINDLSDTMVSNG